MNAYAYNDWIAEYLAQFSSPEHCLGRCLNAVNMMCLSFTELQRVPGHVEHPFCGRRAHWWLVAPDGQIVDPTAAQFQVPPEALLYDPFKPGDAVRVGRCMECGDGIWAEVRDLFNDDKSRSFCDEDCERQFCANF